MTAHVTVADVRTELSRNPDALAQNLLPRGSLARAKYEAGIAFVQRPHGPDDADPEECRRYGLTPAEWAEEMEAALAALRHDARMDAINQGGGRV